MSRIDKATIDRIMDATDIVDVVGDFVSLKRRGSSYLGLCPFHSDRNPSFNVSRSRGIFKCFSCGKAGGAVTFLMDLEGMSYVEALKWLAKKYGIEIQERELTDKERQADAERESMYAVNEFAIKHFERTLAETEEGRNVGLAYFRERGISDAMIAKFHLGYALERSDDLLTKAVAAGFQEKYLLETGLCIRTDRGTLYDRFKGRVIYPVHSLSGRVVAFGGRILKKEKSPAKYVNSPESAIYSKSKELYGMYQARNAISRKKKCILVEGYMDVISMHQAGVENVVASSGTSLTDGQVRMIKRFASNVTLIYDSDAAGIKASLRGINMFVAAGMALKVVLLPEGDDPDSFAQSHSAEEVEAYIAGHEQDLIEFKADILLRDAEADPRTRTEAINDMLGTIALIPDLVEQSIYLDKLAVKSGISTPTLAAQLGRIRGKREEEQYKREQQDRARESITDIENPVPPENSVSTPTAVVKAEDDLMSMVLRNGMLYLCDVYPDAEAVEARPMSVVDYVESELRLDNVSFSDPVLARIWKTVLEIRDTRWGADAAARDAELLAGRQKTLDCGLQDIRSRGADMETIALLEKQLNDEADARYARDTDDFAANYILRMILREPDRAVTDRAASLTSRSTVLSKMYPREDRRQSLLDKLPRAIYTLKNAIIKEDVWQLEQKLRTLPAGDIDRAMEIMKEIMEKKRISMDFDRNNGEIVIIPRRK